jgi:hypothetical protein
LKIVNIILYREQGTGDWGLGTGEEAGGLGTGCRGEKSYLVLTFDLILPNAQCPKKENVDKSTLYCRIETNFKPLLLLIFWR